jgi:hypothetical protein
MDWLKDMPAGTVWRSRHSGDNRYVLLGWRADEHGVDCPVMELWQDGVRQNEGSMWHDWQGANDDRGPYPAIEITYEIVRVPNVA